MVQETSTTSLGPFFCVPLAYAFCSSHPHCPLVVHRCCFCRFFVLVHVMVVLWCSMPAIFVVVRVVLHCPAAVVGVVGVAFIWGWSMAWWASLRDIQNLNVMKMVSYYIKKHNKARKKLTEGPNDIYHRLGPRCP
jgi:hypothetical protein